MADTTERFPRAMRWLHWAGVAGVAGTVALGFLQGDAEASRVLLLRGHLLFGVLIVASTAVRLVVRFRSARPAPLPMAKWRLKIMGLVHGLLYATLLALGLTGIGTALAGGLAPVLLGAESTVPVLEHLVPREVHVTLVLVFLGALAAHIAGIVSYQAREGDALGRMVGRPMPTGAPKGSAVARPTSDASPS